MACSALTPLSGHQIPLCAAKLRAACSLSAACVGHWPMTKSALRNRQCKIPPDFQEKVWRDFCVRPKPASPPSPGRGVWGGSGGIFCVAHKPARLMRRIAGQAAKTAPTAIFAKRPASQSAGCRRRSGKLSPFRSQFSAVPMARRRSLGTATAQALCLCRWSILPRRQKTGFSPQRKAGFQHLQREPENAQCGSRKTRPPQLGITPPRGPRR